MDYIQDCIRIQKVLVDHSYFSDILECEDLWDDVSDHYCASWLFLPEDDNDLWNMIENYVIDRL